MFPRYVLIIRCYNVLEKAESYAHLDVLINNKPSFYQIHSSLINIVANAGIIIHPFIYQAYEPAMQQSKRALMGFLCMALIGREIYSTLKKLYESLKAIKNLFKTTLTKINDLHKINKTCLTRYMSNRTRIQQEPQPKAIYHHIYRYEAILSTRSVH